MAKDVTQLEKSIVNTKAFNYEKMGMTLNFTLNIEQRDQMIAFKELLGHATKDVTAEIAALEEKTGTLKKKSK